MEIVKGTNFLMEYSPEEKKTFYLYMTEASEARPQIYISFSPCDQYAAAKQLEAFNMPMVCMQIEGTETEARLYLEKLEKERTEKWLEWVSQNN